jgi:uracil-DNA glycosylase
MQVLRERLRVEPRPPSVAGGLPVLFFGDALSARVATVGLNPSKFEYLNRSNGMLTGRSQRFATLASLGASSRTDLSDEQADEAIDVMRTYYDTGKPVYGSYFRHLANFLSGMDACYGERTATHLDLVQESTDPVWNQLDVQEKAQLLDRDLPFLAWELEHLPRLQAIVCAGATVSRQVRARVEVDIIETGATKRIRWWLGTARIGKRELPIGGWNYPLDRPTGLGTAGEIELGAMFARKLL